MKIVVDENIEFGKEAFQQFGEVILCHGRKITNDLLKDTEILIVRSITKIDESLLRGTPVKFVGSTTIGMDHVDTEYLDSANIKYTAAPGCNSYAVAEYVITAIAKIAADQNFSLEDKSFGVVGYGNIGKKITRFAKALGMKVLVNDPPLKRAGHDYKFESLDDVLKCDIITLHVPMNKSGIDKTFHLLDKEKIDKLNSNTILINSCRGAVVDNIALLDRLNRSNDLYTVLDVWENEPAINKELLQKVNLATPHIAGYTYEGKVNGTTIIYEKLCEFLDAKKEWTPILKLVANKTLGLQNNINLSEVLFQLTDQIYSIQSDTDQLKSKGSLEINELALQFDLMRKNYNLRREFNNYFIDIKSISPKLARILQELRFNIS